MSEWCSILPIQVNLFRWLLGLHEACFCFVVGQDPKEVVKYSKVEITAIDKCVVGLQSYKDSH